jgi:hypothetical protein
MLFSFYQEFKHMNKILFGCILTLVSFFSFGQDSKGNFIKDKKTDYTVWYKIGFRPFRYPAYVD